MTHTPSTDDAAGALYPRRGARAGCIRNADDAEARRGGALAVADVTARGRRGPHKPSMGEKRSCRSPTTITSRASSAGAPAFCAGRRMYNSGRQDPGGRNRRLRRLPHAGDRPKPDRRRPARAALARKARAATSRHRRRDSPDRAVLLRARVACADAARAVEAVRRLNLPKNARVAAVSPPSSQASQIGQARHRSRGPLLKRLLGASVADLCAASARRGDRRGRGAPLARDGRARAGWTGRARDGRAGVRGGRRVRRRAREPGPRRAHSAPSRGVASGGGGASLLC